MERGTTVKCDSNGMRNNAHWHKLQVWITWCYCFLKHSNYSDVFFLYWGRRKTERETGKKTLVSFNNRPACVRVVAPTVEVLLTTSPSLGSSTGWLYCNWPVRVRAILLVRIAPAVSPAPSAFPTRTHTAIWTLRGNYGFTMLGQFG